MAGAAIFVKVVVSANAIFKIQLSVEGNDSLQELNNNVRLQLEQKRAQVPTDFCTTVFRF